MSSTAEVPPPKLIPMLSSSPPPLNDSLQDLDQSFEDFEINPGISLPGDDLCENIDLYNKKPLCINYHTNESLSNDKSSLSEKNFSVYNEQLLNGEAHQSHNVDKKCVSNEIGTTLNCDHNNVVPDSASSHKHETKITLVEQGVGCDSSLSEDAASDTGSLSHRNVNLLSNATNVESETFEISNLKAVEPDSLVFSKTNLHLRGVDDLDKPVDSSEQANMFESSSTLSGTNDFHGDCDDFGDFSTFQSSSNFDNDAHTGDMASNNFCDFRPAQTVSTNKDNVSCNTENSEVSHDEFGDFNSVTFTFSKENRISCETPNYDGSDTNHTGILEFVEGTIDSKFCENNQVSSQDVRPLHLDDIEDDFGAFNTAEPSTDDDLNCAANDNFDFGDFSTIQGGANGSNFPEFLSSNHGDEFTQFGDFGNAAQEEDTENWAADFQSSEATVVKNSSKENVQINLWTTFTDAFFYPHSSSIIDIVTESIDVIALDSDHSTSCKIFNKLKDIEDSKSLSLQWTCLKSNDFLLKALNIDSRNILFGQSRNPSIPIFASNLGLLEPTKSSDAISKKQSQIDTSQSGSDHPAQLLLPSQTENIPPVQFDWSLSGLTNPLESLSSSTSTLLDLEIFKSSNASISTSNSKSSSLEDEFLSSSPEPTSISTSVLDKLMSSVKYPTFIPQGSVKKRPSGLSDETINVLDKLPSLSFMNAKVLMFPVNSQIPELCP